jgi:hypothetical protein
MICATTPDYEFARHYQSTAEYRNRNGCGCDARSCIHKNRRFDVLPQLFDRVAWAPLQGGLQEMRLLSELLRFLLSSAGCFLTLSEGRGRNRLLAVAGHWIPLAVAVLVVPVSPSCGVVGQRLPGNVVQRLEYPLFGLGIECRIIGKGQQLRHGRAP